MIYLINSIKKITKDKIIFIDNNEVLQEIDLHECSKNWAEHFNNHNFVTWDGNPAPKIKTSENRCVGERNWYAENPYFEFFTKNKIHFEIRPNIDQTDKQRIEIYYHEFRKICIDLEEQGWVTFDVG